MNLNRFYPPIFWATARLMVESGSIELLNQDLELLQDEENDDEQVATTVDYFKMGAALGKLRGFGINIQPPNINTSSFTFSPSVEENTIYFGLKGITRISSSLISEIINNRPYTSLRDFLSKNKVNKIQATMLIKAGAFDEFGSREELLLEYCTLEADTKTRITMQNMAKLVELNLLPEELDRYKKIYKLTKHLKKHFLYGDFILLNDEMLEYVEMFNGKLIKFKDGQHYLVLADWEKWFKKEMENVKRYISSHHDELLAQVNAAAIEELMQKYAKGNRAYQEMEALTYYYSFHELSTPEYQYWLNGLGVSNFNDLPEEPIVEWQSGERKVFRLARIVGTAIGRDKGKQIVGLLTPDGFIKVKFYRSQFIKYDKQIKLNGVIEKSWFSKGTKLLLTGYRDGDTFVPKIYKNSSSKQAIYKIEDVNLLTQLRLGE